MSDGGNARIHDALDSVSHRRSAFELDRVAACLSHESACVANRILDRSLIRHVRHVAHNKSSRRAAPDSLRVADHVIHFHGQGRVETEHGHAEAVANQNHFNFRLLLQISGWIIVAG